MGLRRYPTILSHPIFQRQNFPHIQVLTSSLTGVISPKIVVYIKRDYHQIIAPKKTLTNGVFKNKLAFYPSFLSFFTTIFRPVYFSILSNIQSESSNHIRPIQKPASTSLA